MQIIVEQRYVIKPDGKRWLQIKYLEGVYTHISGSLNARVGPAKISDWEDVPICEDVWPKEDDADKDDYGDRQRSSFNGPGDAE